PPPSPHLLRYTTLFRSHEAVEVAVRGGDEHRAERLEHAQQGAADDAPRDGAEPADDDDLEALEGGDGAVLRIDEEVGRQQRAGGERKSTRLNSSHVATS